MKKSKLGLDFAQVDAAKQLAKNIASHRFTPVRVP